MSKKKATMTLKDFHGGSIPSDLRLPSAPGVIVRPADRGSFDQQSSWGNSMGRSSHRLRPASAGSARNFDDKTPFLSHSAKIGRNFDEDERKPLDGMPGPRRVVSDESIRAPPSRVAEPKMKNVDGARVGNMQSSTLFSQLSSDSMGSSYVGRLSELQNVGGNNQNISGSGSGSGSAGANNRNVGGNARSTVAGSYVNAWGVKEGAGLREPVSAAWSAPDAALTLAHASAIEKVSSGRWHSKHVPQKDVEIIRQSEPEIEFHYRGNDMYDRSIYNGMAVLGGAYHHDFSLGMHMERSLIVDDGIRGGGKQTPYHDRFIGSTMHVESHGKNSSVNPNEFQPLYNAEIFGGSELQSPVCSEASERPKLKLLPRSKPLENLEPLVDSKKGHRQPSDPIHVRDGSESQGTVNPVRPGFAGSMSGTEVVERPKLNLKPRSQPLENLEGTTEIKRNTVFGGARPREVVLKERRVDDDSVDQYVSQTPSRIKHDASKIDTVAVQATATHNSEKAKNVPGDQRLAKTTDRRGQRMEAERTDAERKNVRNENWRNFKEIKKHQDHPQPQLQEKPPSPETWHKPVEHPKSATMNAPGQRYGKTATALELAQAFSRPVSDPVLPDCLSRPRGLPTRGQIPFSRLTGPAPRPRINGY